MPPFLRSPQTRPTCFLLSVDAIEPSRSGAVTVTVPVLFPFTWLNTYSFSHRQASDLCLEPQLPFRHSHFCSSRRPQRRNSLVSVLSLATFPTLQLPHLHTEATMLSALRVASRRTALRPATLNLTSRALLSTWNNVPQGPPVSFHAKKLKIKISVVHVRLLLTIGL